MKFTGFKKYIGRVLLVVTFTACAGVLCGDAHLTALDG